MFELIVSHTFLYTAYYQQCYILHITNLDDISFTVVRNLTMKSSERSIIEVE
jgi:hypothetical protein